MLAHAAYQLSQNARIGWFLGQYLLSNRLSRPVVRTAPPSSARPSSARPSSAPLSSAPAPAAHRRMPTLAELLEDIRELLRRDWQDIRHGLYRAPAVSADQPGRLLADAVRYFRDLPAVTARRRRDGFDDVRRERAGRGFPDYYLRNFHYQTDGYLSRRSARLYDQQVEVLFIGSAETMRRRALVPVGAVFRRRRGAVVHLDVACGTGRFLASVHDNFAAPVSIGLDLSPHYLAEAAGTLRSRPGVTLVQGLAEDLPLADASVDLVTCVYLLHEIPDAVRRAVAGEFARVLRPGGRAVLVDSLQQGDRPAWDGLLDGFPSAFHEPFYAEYARADLQGLFAAAGLRPAGSEIAFLSKVLVFDKPEA